MTRLQIAQQLLLVRVVQRVAVRAFDDARRSQLIEQDIGGFFEFVRELGNSGTGHIVFKPP